MTKKNAIETIRFNHGMTQQEMANYLNISTVTYGKYEKEPGRMSLRMFCKIFSLANNEERQLLSSSLAGLT